jgi:hypothetical protein
MSTTSVSDVSDEPSLTGALPSGRAVRRDVLEALTKSLVLAAASLPLTGVLVRFVAFSVSDSTGASYSLAWSAPLYQLIATGLVATLPVVLIFMGLLRLSEIGSQFDGASVRRLKPGTAGRTLSEPPEAGDEFRLGEYVLMESEHDATGSELDAAGGKRGAVELDTSATYAAERSGPIQGRLRHPMAAIAQFVFSVAVVVFIIAPDVFTFSAAIAVSVVTLRWAVRASKRAERLTLAAVWPFVTVLLVFCAVSGGLGGDLPGTSSAEYTFAGGAAVAPGRYRLVADDGDIMYLLPCSGDATVIGVQRSEVIMIQTGSDTVKSNPSLWSVAFDRSRAHLGLGRCE